MTKYLNLEEYLAKEEPLKLIKLKEFEIFLKETKLLTKNIIPHNLAVKENDSELTLKIIVALDACLLSPSQKLAILLQTDILREGLS